MQFVPSQEKERAQSVIYVVLPEFWIHIDPTLGRAYVAPRGVVHPGPLHALAPIVPSVLFRSP
jgi:hypothetical protein